MRRVDRFNCSVMKRPLVRMLTVVAAGLLALNVARLSAAAASPADGIPQLRRSGTATQLVVDGQPFLVLGGELRNSSSSSRAYMKPIWPRLEAAHLNTVLAGVSWELVEPTEGQFDYTLLDELVTDARAHHLKLVLLWFGAWKNGMSSYAPVWVKRDSRRFPRVQLQNGDVPELLTPLALATADAEARAFAGMMKHLREIDGREHTVLMIQVENEVGVMNDSRDRSPAAEAEFAQPVPAEIMTLLVQHRDAIAPELRAAWEAQGARTSGSWAEIFGPTKPKNFVLRWDLPEPQRSTEWRQLHWPADEFFMAWHYARYVNRVAEAGKREYNLPMFANTWLQQPGCPFPGTYPSGGPMPQVADFWRVGAPSIDILAPDLYIPEFAETCERYTRAGNPLFIPETSRDPRAVPNLFVALGQFNAIGYSPFGIDNPAPDVPPPILSPGGRFATPAATLDQAYAVLQQLAPLLLKYQGTGRMVGFTLDQEHPSLVTKLGETEIEIRRDEAFGQHAEQGYGIVIAVGPDEFYGVGQGFGVVFRPVGATRRGVGTVDEGTFRDGKWIPGRRLNGDETDQGRIWRFGPWGLSIERGTAYRME